MIDIIQENNLLPVNLVEDRGLLNTFNGQAATLEQQYDLLHFRRIGEEATTSYINHQILRQSFAATTTIRRKKLLTMSSTKSIKKRKTVKEKESEKMIKCLQRRLAWCNYSGNKLDLGNERFSIYPRALSDENGVPHKAPKSHWTDKLQEKYKNSQHNVFTNDIVTTWLQPEYIVVLDAMFIINTKPLRSTKTVLDYLNLLFSRYIKEHFSSGAVEVHVIFDTPISDDSSFNPKMVEQLRRDSAKNPREHIHCSLDLDSMLPLMKWQDLIGCRICKYSLVSALGQCVLRNGRHLVQEGKTLVVAGCFQDGIAWKVPCSTTGIPQPEPLYNSNAKEADQRIWRHVANCTAANVIVYSPDTDVYTIGIGLTTIYNRKQVIVQLNPPSSRLKRYVNINSLIKALNDDQDLSAVTEHSKVMLSLFVCTGSDFTSYFRNFGKASFLKIFHQNATFITGSEMPGSMANYDMVTRDEGFLAFIRLVGTAYFKKHQASLSSKYNVGTPMQLYNSLPVSLSNNERHKEWLKKISEIVSERILSEDERVPSFTSLWRHWMRSTYICLLWSNSMLSNIQTNLPNPENSGWLLKDEKYSIDWEDPDEMMKIESNMRFLLRGCTCKTGCTSIRCGCKKAGNICGPGCTCSNCNNREELNEPVLIDDSYDTTSSSSDNEDTEDEVVETEVITDEFVFGNYDIL